MRIQHEPVLSVCTAEERLKVLSYGHTIGKHTKTAQAYHGAQFQVSKATLRGFLSHYEHSEHDEALEDKINWCSQAEYYQEAKQRMESELDSIPTLIHLMDFVPMVCRTLTLKLPVPQGIQMNPWLAKIESMPTILTHMTTYDFFERFNNKKASHNESINGIMLVTRDPCNSVLARGVGKHMSSYLLTRNADLYFPDADLATWAMVAVYILSHKEMTSWMAAELETLRVMHSAVYARQGSWEKYLDVVSSPDFTQALLLPGECANKFCSCPHLNKFMLAVFFRSGSMTAAQLQDRRDKALIEFFGRISTGRMADLSSMFEGFFNTTHEDVLNSTECNMKETHRETLDAFNASLKGSCLTSLIRAYCINNAARKLGISVQLKSLDNTREFECWNLNPLAIEQIFGSIAKCHGLQLPAVASWPSLALTGCLLKTSLLRSRCTALVTLEDQYTQIENSLVADFAKQVYKKAHGHVAKLCSEFCTATHVGIPIRIIPQWAAKFKSKHGVDLLDILDVNEYGMSRTACMFTSCPFFAIPMGKKARGKNGLPRMCDRLSMHLKPLNSVQGLHRTALSDPYLQHSAVLAQMLWKVAVSSLVSTHVHMISFRIHHIRESVPWEDMRQLESIYGEATATHHVTTQTTDTPLSPCR